MKNLLLISAIFLCSSISAQDSTTFKKVPTFKHNINIGYSYNSWNPLWIGLTGFSNGLYDYKETGYFYYLKTNGVRDLIKEKRINSINFGYSASPKRFKVCKFGISGTFDFYKNFENYIINDNTIYTTTTTLAYTIMANAYYHYLKKSKWVDLYLGGDFGIMMIHAKTKDIDNDIKDGNTKVYPMGSFCPFGIRLKTRVSPYLQANIGSRGWVEGGIAFDF
jgi:hypothetical protein